MKKKTISLILILLVFLSIFSGCEKRDPVSENPDSDLFVEEIGEEESKISEEAQNSSSPEKIPKQSPDDEEKSYFDESEEQLSVEEEGEYTSKEEVALYIHQFGKLPSNYITKKEAAALGWKSKEGNLEAVAKGRSIGGDPFGNREKRLPEAPGRSWYECDIDFDGGFRNAKRILFSNDGLIYYTDDHYKTFVQLY